MDTFLLEENQFCKERVKAYEGLFAQGNGYMSVRGSFDEGLIDAPQNEEYDRMMKSVTTEIQRSPLSKWGVYVPTIMGYNPFLEEVILNLPYFLHFPILIDNQPLDLINCEVLNYSRALNIKNGTLNRKVTIKTKIGSVVGFEFERFASMKQKHLFVQRVEINVLKGNAKVKVAPSINADVTTNGRRHFCDIKTNASDNNLSLSLKTDLGFNVCMKSHVECNKKLDWCSNGNDMVSAISAEINMYEGETIEFVKRNVLTTSRDCLNKDYETHAEEQLKKSLILNYENLFKENEVSWNEKWTNSDVVVTGDEELQKGLRFSIYHLLRSQNDDERVQICAKGFAGEAYYGRYFWDTEIYLLPFFIYTNPSAARKLLMYRYNTLNGAKKNAQKYNCKGARYPWQSAIDGTEQCSLWEYADNEVHITADVAFAVMHYYKATNDEDFLYNYGVEILLETARFWLDRVDSDGNGGYNILNVMGPDEYSPMTRNNAYTNFLVIDNLKNAVWAANKMKKDKPNLYKKILKKINFDELEIEKFKEVVDKLPIPYDEKRNLYLQSEDFESFADIDLNNLWKDKSRAFGHFVSQEKIYRTKCIKQADVIALMTLFPERFTDEQALVAYDYYMPLTTHDSSLSPAGHSQIAHRLGKDYDVKRFLNLALNVDLNTDKKGSEDGIHIANCACIWQLVVCGFAGFKTAIESETFKVTPRLPKGIEKIEFKFFWQGKQKKVEVSSKGAVITDIAE